MSYRIGNHIVLCPEPETECELCHKKAETRPYGPNGERICIECGRKNPNTTERKIREVLGL